MWCARRSSIRATLLLALVKLLPSVSPGGQLVAEVSLQMLFQRELIIAVVVRALQHLVVHSSAAAVVLSPGMFDHVRTMVECFLAILLGAFELFISMLGPVVGQ